MVAGHEERERGEGGGEGVGVGGGSIWWSWILEGE